MITQIVAGCIGAALIAGFAFRFGALNFSGAISAFFVGAVIFGIGGLIPALVLILFFVTGSALSRLPEAVIQDKVSRDWKQVLANGGIGATAILIGHLMRNEAVGLLFYYGSIATAAADTWATEIGTRWGNKPRNILTMKRLAPGLSGGVSGMGLIASALGALLIAIAAALDPRVGHRYLAIVLTGTATGLFGSIIDSILGSLVQAKYWCSACGQIVEKTVHCGQNTTLLSGFGWITNNAVNLISVTLGGVFLWMALDFAR